MWLFSMCLSRNEKLSGIGLEENWYQNQGKHLDFYSDNLKGNFYTSYD